MSRKAGLYDNLLFALILSVMIFAPIARGAVRPWSATPVMLILYAAIFLRLIKTANSADNKLQITRLDLPIFLFSLLAVISFVFSVYKHDSFYAMLRLFAYIGLYYLVADGLSGTARRLLVWVAISVGGCLSVYGLLQYFGVLDRSWWFPEKFLAATYVNHNHFAGYLELVIPAVVMLISAAEGSGRIAASVALIPCVAAMILTQSRGAWMSIILAFMISAVFLIRKGFKISTGFVMAALAMAAIVTVIYFGKDTIAERVGTITEAREGIDVSGGSFMIWQGAVNMIKERPLTGFGIGNFDRGFYRFRPEGFNLRAVYAHNEYLQSAAEMGLIAPVAIVWILALVVFAGLNSGKGPYSSGCAIGILSLAIHGSVDFNFHIPAKIGRAHV